MDSNNEYTHSEFWSDKDLHLQFDKFSNDAQKAKIALSRMFSEIITFGESKIHIRYENNELKIN